MCIDSSPWDSGWRPKGGDQRNKIYAQEMIWLIKTQVVTSVATAQATEVAHLKQKVDVADDDITLINRRLDEAQGMSLGHSVYAIIMIWAWH